MAKKQAKRGPAPRNGKHGGAGKKARVSGRATLEEEARATFFSGEDEELSSESEGELPSGDEAGEDAKEESVEAARMKYARAYLEEARADERAAKKKQGYRYDEKRDVLDEDDDDDDDDDDGDGDDDDDDESEDDRVGARLRRAREAEASDAFEELGARLEALGFDGDVAATRGVKLAGHRGPPTCVALCERGGVVFSGAKDNALLVHDAETGAKLRVLLPRWPNVACGAVEDARAQAKGRSMRRSDGAFDDAFDGGGGQGGEPGDDGGPGARRVAPRQAHEAEVLAVACSPDGRYLASGGTDALVHVWDARTFKHVHSLRGHRGAVSCLAFRDDAHALFEDATLAGGGDADFDDDDARSQLFSGGDDGAVKHWTAARGAYVETLFGHEAPVRSLDCAYDEKPLSGGRDRTARAWKICDESHLVYRAPAAAGLGLGSSVDACRILDKDRFLTGGDDGALALWSSRRKKPVVAVPRAHGAGSAAQALGAATHVQGDFSARVPRWLQAVTSPRHADVVASGSCDGHIRLWQIAHKDAPKQTLQEIHALPQLGFVNALAAPRDAKFLAAAVAKEPRLGRWESVRKAPNAVFLFPLNSPSAAL